MSRTVTVTSPTPHHATSSLIDSKLQNQMKKTLSKQSGALKMALLIFLISGSTGFAGYKFNPLFFKGYLVVLALAFCVWLLSIPLHDVSIADPLWALGFVVLAWVYRYLRTGHLLSGDAEPLTVNRSLMVTILVTIWGLRLFFHLLTRKIGTPEDHRYQAFRRQFGKDRYWWFSLIQTFLFQITIMWWISYPLFISQDESSPNLWSSSFDFIGVSLWAIGLYFETVGDYQLKKFKANPANKGKLLTSGLWSRTRHPNYFGDAAVWWGIFLLVLPCSGGYLSVYSPTLMTLLLRYVSGVPILENALLKSGKPGVKEYLINTNAFFPRLL
jgi:steroid 5-alpha reductase family enzyme